MTYENLEVKNKHIINKKMKRKIAIKELQKLSNYNVVKVVSQLNSESLKDVAGLISFCNEALLTVEPDRVITLNNTAINKLKKEMM